MQGPQISELLGIIERQGSHLEQYRSVLDAQRQTNTSLNAGCERIQARYRNLSSHESTRLALVMCCTVWASRRDMSMSVAHLVLQLVLQ